MTDIQSRINKINRDYVKHLKTIGGGMPSRNLGRPVGGAKQGGAWYDDLEDVAITGAHIVRPFLGLGKVKKGKKGGAKFKEDKTQNKEPVEQSTLQHLYENPRELRTGLNVLYSQPPPTQLRDQAIRPDMPLDLTEVVKPPPEMSVWEAMKKGFEMPFKVIASAFGGAKPPKRKGKKGGNFLMKGKPIPKRGELIKPKQSFLKDVFKQIEERQVPTPTGAGKKKPSKWIEHVKAYAKKHNMKYNEALKDANCKKEYHDSK